MPAFLKLQRYARHVIDDCAFAARVEASYGVAFVLSLAGLAGTLLGARQGRHMLAASVMMVVVVPWRGRGRGRGFRWGDA